MPTLEVIAQEDLEPAVAHAIDTALVDAVRRGARPAVLRAYSFRDPTVVLGRYHLAPTPRRAAAAGLHRRLSGGRLAALGPGFAAVALLLPHRSALVAAEPLALRPEQALNRFARGILTGLRGLGVDAFYPGRDLLTLDRRRLGVVALESDAHGVAIFEAFLAIDGDWRALAGWTEAVDPDGVIAAERLTADEVAAVARRGARRPSLDELAQRLAAAFEHEFGTATAVVELGTVPVRSDEEWLTERRRRPELDRRAMQWGQLGVFETYLRCDGAGAIADLTLAGDFIADSPSIAALETQLRGCRLERAAIYDVVQAIFRDPRHFLLGLDGLQVADAIAGAR